MYKRRAVSAVLGREKKSQTIEKRSQGLIHPLEFLLP
jgi:hypothetical protein